MKENSIEQTEENKGKLSSDMITDLSSSSLDKKETRSESIENDNIKEEDHPKIILELQEKIIILEKENNDLRTKNENLTKNNIEKNSIMAKMSLVGLRRGFAFQDTLDKVQNDSVKLAEIIKEKDDLQEINEKMLDLLTEKEIENEDLLQKLENYKLEFELENEKNLEKIQILEEKIVNLENSKKNEFNASEMDGIINEYNNYKERLKKQMDEYFKNEGDLREKLNVKDRTIQRLKEEIQGLELDNLQLVSQSKNNDKINEKEIIEIEQLKSENEKIKREMGILDEKLKLTNENAQKENKLRENEINEYQKKIENEQNYLKIYKENNLKEINLLKNEIAKYNKEINFYNKKIETTEKLLNEEKQKIANIQNKLDKKTKELQEITEYSKKLLANKDNLLSQYEVKIEKITKDKNDLIAQNKELLEKIKLKNEEGSSATNLADILNEDKNNNNNNNEIIMNNKEDLELYAQESKLLHEEIKELKLQLNSQAKELVELNTLEKEVLRLRTENENLINDNKTIKNQLREQKKKEEQIILTTKKKQLTKAVRGLRRKSIHKFDKLIYEKQFDAFKKLKEDEKKYYEEQIKKLKKENDLLKIKNTNQQNKLDSLLSIYKNKIKLIYNKYIKKYLIYIICAIILLIAIKKMRNIKL